MTNNNTKKFVNYSPVGVFHYPKLNKPDVPTKFKGAPTYQVELHLEKGQSDVEEFMSKLETHVFSKLNEGDYRPVKETDTHYIIKAKKKAEYGAPKFFEPKANGESGFNMLDKVPGLVWSGTEGSISFTTYQYSTGVTFALCGVTITKLVEPPAREDAPASVGNTNTQDEIFG